DVAELTDNPAVSAQAVDELVASRGEPAWLADERRAALRTFDATQRPGQRDALRRDTRLERVSGSGLDLVIGILTGKDRDHIDPRIRVSDAEGIMVVKNGRKVRQEARIKESGVIFTDMATALREHEDLVRQHLYTAVNAPMTKFTALNSALWTGGTFVYVPKDVEVELPLGTFTTADRGGLGAGRTLIVVDVNAKATFIDEFTSDPL